MKNENPEEDKVSKMKTKELFLGKNYSSEVRLCL